MLQCTLGLRLACTKEAVHCTLYRAYSYTIVLYIDTKLAWDCHRRIATGRSNKLNSAISTQCSATEQMRAQITRKSQERHCAIGKLEIRKYKRDIVPKSVVWPWLRKQILPSTVEFHKASYIIVCAVIPQFSTEYDYAAPTFL